MTDLQDIWNQTRAELRRRLSDTSFQMWIDPLRPAGFDHGTLVLEAPEAIRSWIQDRFESTISESISAISSELEGVRIAVAGSAGNFDVSGAKPANAESSLAENASNTVDTGSFLDLDPKLTFDQFVIGEANRLAHAAALASAEMPSQAYNPLFIYGPPGTGKTHLLNAIGNLTREHSPTARIRIASAEQFTSRFIRAIQAGETADFKADFRDVDLLLLDDAQFLENKTRTEEEFFHTFNHLIASGAQVVITCDRTPDDLESMEERLRDRFASGLVVDICSPDTPTRVAILANRARRDGLGEIPVEALEEIAGRIRGNGRALEGALIRVVAYASLTRSKLSGELATQVLDQLYPRKSEQTRSVVTSREIKTMVAEVFGVRPEDLDSSSRAAHVVWPRQVAMYLTREIAGEPLPKIGSDFGGRNHSTVVNACKRVRQRVAADPQAAMTVRSLERRIVGGDDRRD